nr:nuclear transport factor 2 family protein [Rhodococcus sp. HNM0563]
MQATIEQLAGRVAALESERAAAGLMHRYAAQLDAPAPEKLALLFADDGALVTRLGTFRGHDEIGGFFRTAGGTDPSEKRHFVCQPEVRSISTGLVQLDCYFGYTARAAHGSGLGWGTYSAVIRTEVGDARFESLAIDVHVGTDLARGWPREH